MSHHLVGASEVAEILGVSRQRVAQLVAAGGFPDPAVELAAGRVWERAAIEGWATTRGATGAVARPTDSQVATKWSPDVQQVLDLASAEAVALGHEAVGCDHLCLAMLHPESPGSARAALESLGLTLEETRSRVARAARAGSPSMATDGPRRSWRIVPPRTLIVLERARRTAVELRDEHVSSEHVLLALLEEWDRFPPSSLFAQLGLDSQAVRDRVLTVAEQPPPAESAPGTTPAADVDSTPPAPAAPSAHIAHRAGIDLATNPDGADPGDRRPWSSAVVLDPLGRPVTRGRALLQFFRDADGHPVLSTAGRPVHLLVSEHGDLVLDVDGDPVLAEVDIPLERILRSDGGGGAAP